jgi:hypothetical protein
MRFRRPMLSLITATLVASGLWLAASATVLAGACTITGTDGPEELHGTPGDDVICEFGGSDVIFGYRGDDVLRGGRGSDILGGGLGNDRLRGGPGDDPLDPGRGADISRGGGGQESSEGSPGSDRWFLGPGSDVAVDGNGIDRLVGGPGGDFCLQTRDQLGGDAILGGRGSTSGTRTPGTTCRASNDGGPAPLGSLAVPGNAKDPRALPRPGTGREGIPRREAGLGSRYNRSAEGGPYVGAPAPPDGGRGEPPWHHRGSPGGMSVPRRRYDGFVTDEA